MMKDGVGSLMKKKTIENCLRNGEDHHAQNKKSLIFHL
jgi:hypothetical protein